MIDSRSKCYKKLSDLNNLKLSGVLTADEYAEEMESMLKSVKTSGHTCCIGCTAPRAMLAMAFDMVTPEDCVGYVHHRMYPL